MFDITRYGEKVLKIGGRNFKVGHDQEEIHKSGKWRLHLKGESKNGFKNYCLYLDKNLSQKKVWYLNINSGIFVNNRDFKDLRKNSPETLAWVFSAINGNKYSAPYPDGFVSDSKIGRPKKDKSNIPVTKEEKYESKKWSALPSIIDYLRTPSWPTGLFKRSKENFNIDPDDARDIFDCLRHMGFIEFMSGQSLKIKDVDNEAIYKEFYRSGKLNGVKGVDWIDRLRLQSGR